MLIKRRRAWALPERLATPEGVYENRRQLIRRLAATGAIAAAWPVGVARGETRPSLRQDPRYPAERNPSYALDRPLTAEADAASFNIFDEFSVDHEQVAALAEGFRTDPWTVHIGGRVPEARTFDVEDLIAQFGLEERLYRHRCVEAWAMAVPWTGFPLSKLISLMQPPTSARYVRFISVMDSSLPGWFAGRRVFPYYEALSMEEATNELAFLATGIYGHPLPPQHGAPLRLVTPWKYGFKSIKSIVAIQFTAERPGTFWNDLAPEIYTWAANVDPPNFKGSWSQETETMLGTEEQYRTQLYNGYAEQVAHLYA